MKYLAIILLILCGCKSVEHVIPPMVDPELQHSAETVTNILNQRGVTNSMAPRVIIHPPPERFITFGWDKFLMIDGEPSQDVVVASPDLTFAKVEVVTNVSSDNPVFTVSADSPQMFYRVRREVPQ